MKYIIEGLDRLGKDTLVKNIQDRLGFHQVLHYSKPIPLKAFDYNLRTYQEASFKTMFELLNLPAVNFILNRAHLGECVYAPLYRGYSGDYVFELEKKYSAKYLENSKLILLTEDIQKSTHFVDDGKSLGKTEDRANEQILFVQAFQKSIFLNKQIVCVTNKDGNFKDEHQILNEVLE